MSTLNTPNAILGSFDNALRTLLSRPQAIRSCPKPADSQRINDLSVQEQALSGALMRVNHVGEICAQALYAAQALSTNDPVLRQKFTAAGIEEGDHLAWTRERLDELGARQSLLNPLWYAGAFGLGLLAGGLGDKVSLGFLAETERLVEAHLADHLDRLPHADLKSKAIVIEMKDDEARHARQAESSGAIDLPLPVKALMVAAAKVMTTVAHRV